MSLYIRLESTQLLDDKYYNNNVSVRFVVLSFPFSGRLQPLPVWEGLFYLHCPWTPLCTWLPLFAFHGGVFFLHMTHCELKFFTLREVMVFLNLGFVLTCSYVVLIHIRDIKEGMEYIEKSFTQEIWLYDTQPTLFKAHIMGQWLTRLACKDFIHT